MPREVHNDWEFKGSVTFGNGVDAVDIFSGTGSPEGVVTASQGSIFLRTDGGSGTTLYVKESGTGNTGWIAFSVSAGTNGLDGLDANRAPAPFSVGGTLTSPTTGTTLMVWRAPFACVVTNVRTHFKGGTSIVCNARKNQTSNHLASDYTNSSANAWGDGGAVQNIAYATGDDLEIMFVTINGSVTEASIQVDFVRI